MDLVLSSPASECPSFCRSIASLANSPSDDDAVMATNIITIQKFAGDSRDLAQAQLSPRKRLKAVAVCLALENENMNSELCDEDETDKGELFFEEKVQPHAVKTNASSGFRFGAICCLYILITLGCAVMYGPFSTTSLTTSAGYIKHLIIKGPILSSSSLRAERTKKIIGQNKKARSYVSKPYVLSTPQTSAGLKELVSSYAPKVQYNSSSKLSSSHVEMKTNDDKVGILKTAAVVKLKLRQVFVRIVTAPSRSYQFASSLLEIKEEDLNLELIF